MCYSQYIARVCLRKVGSYFILGVGGSYLLRRQMDLVSTTPINYLLQLSTIINGIEFIEYCNYLLVHLGGVGRNKTPKIRHVISFYAVLLCM